MERRSEEQKIISILKKQPESRALNTLEIASALKVDRHTAIKYLEAMESKGIIRKETKRRAKVWRISETPVADVLKRKDLVSKQLADILDTVDQHISIQDKKLEIIWKNHYAKSKNTSAKNNKNNKMNAMKCHEAYFDKNCRCKDCPVEKTFQSGKSETKEMKIPGGIRKIITRPLKDGNHNTMAVVEIIKETKNKRTNYAN